MQCVVSALQSLHRRGEGAIWVEVFCHTTHPQETPGIRTTCLQTCGTDITHHQVHGATGAGETETPVGINGRHTPVRLPCQWLHLTLLQTTINHLERPSSYVRILFLDFSSTLNCMQPHMIILSRKLLGLQCPPGSDWEDTGVSAGEGAVCAGGNDKCNALYHHMGTPRHCTCPTPLPHLHGPTKGPKRQRTCHQIC